MSEWPIAHVVLFHHALGLTEGVRDFAEQLRVAGHTVDTPDLFGGRVYDTLDAGVARAEEIGFEQLAEHGAQLVADTDGPVAVAGFSLGALPAQCSAQTLPNVTAAVLYHSAIPLEWFGDEWPAGVALQIHLGERDPWAQEDADAARALADAGGELFWYDTDRHLVCDATTPDHDPELAAVILERTLGFLA